jgi:hypothetical protein
VREMGNEFAGISETSMKRRGNVERTAIDLSSGLSKVKKVGS